MAHPLPGLATSHGRESPSLTDYLFFRLILPYERYIKGEEDKPLPQVKPRKQEVAQEVESKIKLTGTKRMKQENVKSKKEREEAPKPQDPAEVSSGLCVPNVSFFDLDHPILIAKYWVTLFGDKS